MEKTITLDSGECELVTRLATKAIAEGYLDGREGGEARSVRRKIVEAESVLVI